MCLSKSKILAIVLLSCIAVSEIHGAVIREGMFFNITSDDDSSIEAMASSAGYIDMEALKIALVKEHNIVRKKHGAPALTYNKDLEVEAQRYAEVLGRKKKGLAHDMSNFKHGENLFALRRDEMPDAAELAKLTVDTFYAEKKFYQNGVYNPAGLHDYGHFTQMVWKNTKEVGVGAVVTPAKSLMGTPQFRVVVVMRYSPPGNILSKKQFAKNIE
uniref:SCP domain-containing protein n=1 Tax=Rhabditophanes sp. KR3021 TaxID=114890 RepID=A0AC35U2E8_9BILA